MTLEATTISGGIARNVIPERCETFLDVRSIPSYSHEELASRIQARVESNIYVHSDWMVPVDTRADQPIVKACLAANPGSVTIGSPTMSDWIYLKGIPTVKVGPGDSNLSHTAGERIHLDHLEQAARLYHDTVVEFFNRINERKTQHHADLV